MAFARVCGRRVKARLDLALESSPLAERRGSGHGHSVLWGYSYLSRGRLNREYASKENL